MNFCIVTAFYLISIVIFSFSYSLSFLYLLLYLTLHIPDYHYWLRKENIRYSYDNSCFDTNISRMYSLVSFLIPLLNWNSECEDNVIHRFNLPTFRNTCNLTKPIALIIEDIITKYWYKYYELAIFNYDWISSVVGIYSCVNFYGKLGSRQFSVAR